MNLVSASNLRITNFDSMVITLIVIYFRLSEENWTLTLPLHSKVRSAFKPRMSATNVQPHDNIKDEFLLIILKEPLKLLLKYQPTNVILEYSFMIDDLTKNLSSKTIIVVSFISLLITKITAYSFKRW